MQAGVVLDTRYLALREAPWHIIPPPASAGLIRSSKRPSCPPSQRERGLCLPHLDISDLRQVDWAALHGAGFRAAIFDKDNTLTVPYTLELQPSAAESLARCRSHFGDAIALFSNSAGLAQFDPEGVCLYAWGCVVWRCRSFGSF